MNHTHMSTHALNLETLLKLAELHLSLEYQFPNPFRLQLYTWL